MFEIRDFRILEEIVHTGSLSGAARTLGMSQPAISQHLAILERRVGAPLVVRARTGITLTEAGRSAASHIRTVLDAVRMAESEVATVVGLRSAAVRIACFPSASATILPTALGALRRTRPALRFTVVDVEPPEALRMLEAGECDIAIIFDYNDGTELELPRDTTQTPLIREQIHAILPENHPLAASDSIELSMLASESWIAGCPQCRANMLRTCERAGFTPAIDFQTDDYLALQRMVAVGLGVAVVPELVTSVVEVPGLSRVRVEPPSIRTVNAVRSGRTLNSLELDATIAALVEAGQFLLPAPA